jgi:hypothetical protein
MTNYATAKQLSFITRLSTERGLSVPDFAGLTVQGASATIANLLGIPKTRTSMPSTSVTELGMYRNADGVIFKVQRSRNSGHLYANQLNASGRGFTYSQGAIRTLTPADRMTLVEVQLFGMTTGNCCMCGRELTDPVSVAQGIGPVCLRSWA